MGHRKTSSAAASSGRRCEAGSAAAWFAPPGRTSSHAARLTSLSLTTALAAIVATLVSPGAAEAACTTTTVSHDKTMNCSGTVSGGGSVYASSGTATVNLNGGTYTNSGGVGIQGSGKNGVTLTTTGTNSVTGSEDGIRLGSSDGSVTLDYFSASATGNDGFGIIVNAPNGDIEANYFSGSATGYGNSGLRLNAGGDITANSFSGTGTSDTGAGVRFDADGDVTANDFSGSGINTGGNGNGVHFVAGGSITATNFGGTGTSANASGIRLEAGENITFTSNASASASGGDYGLWAASSSLSSGIVSITTTGGSFSGTADAGAYLAGPTVTLDATDTSFSGGTDGVAASGANVQLTFTNATVTGDADQDGVGSGIRISNATTAQVTVGAGSTVTGSGQSLDDAVISITSSGSSTITVGAGALVSSWHYTGEGDSAGLATAAGDIAIATSGGATTIDNDGTIIGRVSLTDSNDTFNNNSSNTWITVGDNQFGAGNDTVNNVGRTETAVQGAVAETTNFYGLETFVNGDPDSEAAGLLTMIDETSGQIAFDGARDVTYVSGVFDGVGNSTVGLDTYLGKAGSTSDVLAIGGLDEDGNLIDGAVTLGQTALLIHDVNSGAGAFNLAGIEVVDVEDSSGVTYGKYDSSHTASFVISPESDDYSTEFGGVIDKGLFFYDLAVIGNDQYLVGLPDTEAFQLPKLVTGAQSIWQETSSLWLGRQADLRSYLDGSQRGTPASKATGADPRQPASAMPGVWVKMIGSWSSRNASNSFTAYGHTYHYDTGYRQDQYGFMAGIDFAKEGVGSTDGTLLFGMLGGYVTSNLDFHSSPNSADYTGESVGAYASYLNSGWFVDSLFKADFLSLTYKAPTLVSMGYSGQSTNARNLGFVLDAGYRMQMGTSGFIEPSATLNYVNTTIDKIAFGDGTTADFGGNDSLRGGVGARLGLRAYDTAAYGVEASLTGRLWYEFEGDNAVTLLNPGDPFVATDKLKGLFGEAGVGLKVFGKDNGWSGFTDASALFGEKYVAASVKAGLRYQW
ncbi:autotransporter domain-containing protein [Labrys monachus]|uniref:Autotransporter domain-containing protein n=1 Tax=Labrys monachus TaxID=217067 RepID=A0ABU0F7W7_9HYPH|nr:autotransporter domain-containing protein [Labrys monachus]MDQ0390701.1 hypothetical protein [Labrys monachus]